MECRFTVGQKVILARSFGAISLLRAAEDGVTLPVKGVVYTIREFDDQRSEGFGLALRLNEITNVPHYSNGLEPSFMVSLFEPVVERKTDISVFKAMLNPSREGVPA
ncbi:hypothetical protein [Agrobacterium pusense]|uniref:hypothetical protein n=1 Tax=Agrobacterium pusense TaxID=648995 RepID=UPI0010AE5EE6|nr:hypothetical protein [Agrobacterium pusense]WCK26614.1 hypothetical protein CFBP5496_0020655 [Agrobacterium pusense]